MKYFLNENNSSFSNNVDGVVDTTLSTKVRLLPNNDIITNFSLVEQYNKERDECSKFRLIFNINPICSNVLFNVKSEIVVKEGSSEAKCLFDDGVTFWGKPVSAINSTESIKYIDAIRNTEYNHNNIGNYIYHCGLDIFNNHMLRSNTFTHVYKNKNDDIEKKEGEYSDGKYYNTILDLMRYNNGEVVYQNVKIYENPKATVPMHLYTYDNVLSFKNAFSERCKEKDGWWGFINPGNINIANRGDDAEYGIRINRMFPNNKPCEFIDLYPDRTLFSFNPKFNKYRMRSEKNWDYCITYPSKNDYDLVKLISGIIDDNGKPIEGEVAAIKINFTQKINSNGIYILQCESYFKHNLNVGDTVTFYYYNDINDTLNKLRTPIKVTSVGDLTGNKKEHIFSVNFNDIKAIFKNFIDKGCFFRKNVYGTECSYYARIFSKIKNADGTELKTDINKVAFGKNIYGDDTSQLLFLDDIDIDGLVDNNGRPVSSVYLTIVKRNAGNKEWYLNNNTSGDTIEFSHCFGEVTSGLDFSGMVNEPDNFNIHKMHNVRVDDDDKASDTHKNTIKAWGDAVGIINSNKEIEIKEIPTIESAITIAGSTIMDEDSCFYGDIVEYDFTQAKETVISNIYHRFNTMQREIFKKEYRDIYQDVIIADDYDASIGTTVKLNEDVKEVKKFSVFTYWLNDVEKTNNIFSTNGFDTSSDDMNSPGQDATETLMHGNISPEGYFYNPHNKIKLVEEEDIVSHSEAKLINFDVKKFKYLNNSEIEFEAPTNFGFYKGDYIAFYNFATSEVFWGEIFKVEGNKISLRFNDNELTEKDFIIDNKKKMYAYWSPNNVPTYAKFDVSASRFSWRRLIPQSELDSIHDLYNTTFANGRLYIEQNINFFLRRQDPNGVYGLSKPLYFKNEAFSNPMEKFVIMGHKPYDFSLNEFRFGLNDVCY